MSVTVHDGLLRHPKFLRFAAQAGIDPARALFALVAVWSCALGRLDEVVGDADDVERIAGWDGERGVLAAAMVEAGGPGRSGLLEVVEGGRLSVHDLWDWAPEPERKRKARAVAKAAVSTVDVRGAERRRTAPNGAERRPAPFPLGSPAPPPDPNPKSSGERQPARVREGRAGSGEGQQDPDRLADLAAVREVYPPHRLGVHAEAEVAWRLAVRSGVVPDLAALVAAVERDGRSAEWLRSGGRFVPSLRRWVEGRGWVVGRPDEGAVGGEVGTGRGGRVLAFDTAPWMRGPERTAAEVEAAEAAAQRDLVDDVLHRWCARVGGGWVGEEWPDYVGDVLELVGVDVAPSDGVGALVAGLQRWRDGTVGAPVEVGA